MLIGTPLSATRMCLGDGDRRTEELPAFEEGIYIVFCLPLEAGDLSAPVLAPRISLWETSSSPHPSVSFHMSEPKQTLHVAKGTFPASPWLFGNTVHLTLRAFVAGLIEFWSLFISQHIKQINSKYKYVPFILSLRFNSHGYNLCSVLVLRCNNA